MAYTAYIVSADYSDTYKGIAIESSKFNQIALRASDEIDRLTLHQVRKSGLSSFSTADQEQIKLATCALAEALSIKDSATEGTGVITTSEKVGPYSYSIDKESLDQVWNDAIVKAENFLLFTGLLYRGIGRPCG